MSRFNRFPFVTLLFLSAIALASLGDAAQDRQAVGADLFANLSWRHLGPGQAGGRIADVEAVADNPATIFVAASSGGIFKTVNNGMTWRPVFDQAGGSLAIGDIALAPSDPLIVWAGTGEASCEQNSASIGDGVYKSIDGGESWQCMGLKKSWHIARIVIDPVNPNKVFVGVAGALWGPNPERGVFRTKNGGSTWEKTLYLNEDTGIADLAIDPTNGKIIYAATYQRRRHAWAHVKQGPHSALYRSTDGGDTWEKLTKGLPEGDLGRIGLAVAPSNPQVVYACVEASGGGWFRSDDRGNSWAKMSDRSTSYWYGRIFVDPLNENKVWLMGTSMGISLDGGKTWDNGHAPLIHVDHHTIWINPANTDHWLLGNDGGFHMSYDDGRNWDFVNNLPIGQFYAISHDNRDFYWVYGGLQDNGVWGVASRTHNSLGILNEDVAFVSGGDGFYSAVDPRDHTAIYSESQNGGLVFIDLKTQTRRSIKPRAPRGEDAYRFNWNSPLFISPHNPDILYFGGNRLFKTSDRGANWETISKDLSKNRDLSDVLVMGKKPTLKPHATITALNESPVKRGVIYAGTDDGNLHVTRDDGRHWNNLTKLLPGPQDRFINRVLPSHHDAATAYAAYGRYLEANDFTPYLFKTTDYGQTWKSVAGDLPKMAVVKGLAEHPRNPNLLFAGVHNGAFVTIDGGKHWTRLGGNLPPVAVDDIKIPPKQNDLVLGSYGRGIIILDDIGMLEQLNEDVLAADAYLFQPRETKRHYSMQRWMFSEAAIFNAPNPDSGVLISYYLKDEPAPPAPPTQRRAGQRRRAQAQEQEVEQEEAPPSVQVVVLDKEGNVVRELTAPDRKGLNRISWNMQGSGGRRTAANRPEEFTIKLIARGKELTQQVVVLPDPDK